MNNLVIFSLYQIEKICKADVYDKKSHFPKFMRHSVAQSLKNCFMCPIFSTSVLYDRLRKQDRHPLKDVLGAAAAMGRKREERTMITLFIFGIICCFLDKDDTAEIAICACRAVQA